MRAEAVLKSACDAVEAHVHANPRAPERHLHYLSLARLPLPVRPLQRPALQRQGTGFHELRGLLSDRLDALDGELERARDRAEAGALRWGMRVAWWWFRRRIFGRA